MIIKCYTEDLRKQYEQLLFDSPVSVFSHSLKYRKFLRTILSDSEDHYLCCIERNKIVAALPLFIKNGPYGRVFNSLPFFGSHGGFVYCNEFTNDHCIMLLKKLETFIGESESLSCTLIESPFETQDFLYESFNGNTSDVRVGQITLLPKQDAQIPPEVQLLILYHQKTRNMVRKGLKNGFEVVHSGSIEIMRALYVIHKKNIESIGGRAKQWDVFTSIYQIFEYDKDYRIYTARKGGKIVSALLLFYFKDTVEYFTPATLEEYRSLQPLSALIYRAMLDAIVEKKMRRWNWGGTWLSQTGVYKFKSGWGTQDFPYRYHVKLFDTLNKLKYASSEDLLLKYQNFYVVPF